MSVVFLLHKRKFAIVLHPMWMACCVARALSALGQWSFFNGLAACERAEQCMVEVYTCFERGLGLDLQCLLSSCSTSANLLLCCITCGWHAVLLVLCRLWANGPSSMSLQLVSVQNNVCQRFTHALSVVWDLTLQCLLAPRPHVCCCVAPRVADKLCCHRVSALGQWSFFNELAARECAEVCIVKILLCFERCLGLDFAMSACSTTACLPLCCTTCG